MVEPASFTLQPGGTQEITVEAHAEDVATDTYAFGEVRFTPDGGSDPAVAHMPVAVRKPRYALPYTVLSEVPVYEIASGTADGSWAIDGIRSQALSGLTVETLGLVVPEIAEVQVGQDSNASPWDGMTGTATVVFEVPTNTLRLTAELRGSEAQNANVWMGVDTNGDGIAQQTEARCASQSPISMDLCTLFNPTPVGQWWLLVHNVVASDPEATDTVNVYYGAVTPGEGCLSAVVPSSVAVDEPWALDLEWDLESAEVGSIFYGAAIVTADDGPVFTMHLDVNGMGNPKIYLPDVRYTTAP
jgi:hypothetical protein